MAADFQSFSRSPGVPSWPEIDATDFRPVLDDAFSQTITERFLTICKDWGDRVAIVAEWEMTYAELLTQSQQLASTLSGPVADQEAPIAILASTGIPMVTAIFGTLFAGGSYLPLDIQDSQTQWARTIDEMGCRRVLASQNLLPEAEKLLECCSELIEVQSIEALGSDRSAVVTLRPIPITSQTPACVFYTSGSSGKSVGVSMNHGFVMSDIARQTNDLAIHPEDRLDLLFSPVFSASLAPVFAALLNGASLWIYDTAERGIHQLAGWLEDSRISISNMSVSTMRALLSSVEGSGHFDSLRLLSVGGEPLKAADVQAFQTKVHPGCWLQNAMAATETRTYAQCFISHNTLVSDPVPVGSRVLDRKIRVENELGVELPDGELGAITVDGFWLANGYVNHPVLTAERFETLPNGSVRFHTGDRGYLDPQRRLICLGRSDSIVKIRGHRVELHSVEQGFESLAQVKRAVLMAYPGDDGGMRLAAFLMTHEAVAIDDLRRDVAKCLPHFAMPQKILLLDSYPETRTGKIDRQKLRNMIVDKNPIDVEPVLADKQLPAEIASIEDALSNIWADVLEQPVQVTDNFYSLGGDSLLAVSILARIFRDLGRALSYQEFREHPTIEKLSRLLSNSSQSSSMVTLCEGPRPRIHPPVFLVSGIFGHASIFKALANELEGHDLDVYVFETSQISFEPGEAVDLVGLANRFVEQMLTITNGEAVVLGGYSWGGLVAQEMACQLMSRGVPVSLLAIFDAPAPQSALPIQSSWLARGGSLILNLPHWIRYDLLGTSIAENRTRVRGVCEQIVQRISRGKLRADQPNLKRYFGTSGPTGAKLQHFQAKYRAYVSHQPAHFIGPVIVFRARAQSLSKPPVGALGWQHFCDPAPQIQVIKGSHTSMMQAPYVGGIARFLKRPL